VREFPTGVWRLADASLALLLRLERPHDDLLYLLANVRRTL
jgi:hypothetical protein